MAYTPQWEPLANALRRVCSTGQGEDQAKNEIAHAIADRAVSVRVQIAGTDRDVANQILENRNISVPKRLSPADFDWQRSRPIAPWLTGPDRVQSYFAMWDWKPRPVILIEVATADVSRIWGNGRPVQSTEVLFAPPTTNTPEIGKLVPANRRSAAAAASLTEPGVHERSNEFGPLTSPMDDEAFDDPPPWNLWQFARVVAPQHHKEASKCGLSDPPIDSEGYLLAESRARDRYPNVQKHELTELAGQEIDRLKKELHARAEHLIRFEIPDLVRRALAGGGYEVTCYGANGERIALVQEVLGGLEPNLCNSSLKGDGAEFLGVRVAPPARTDVQVAAPRKQQSEKEQTNTSAPRTVRLTIPNKPGGGGKKTAAAIDAMVQAVKEGQVTFEKLRGMKQKALVQLYRHAGRTTLTDAREIALAKLKAAGDSDKAPT